MRKFRFGIGLLGGGLVLAGVRKAWTTMQPAGVRLRNHQGVGPAHFPGTNRGEDRAKRKGSDETATVAGRQAGSIKPGV